MRAGDADLVAFGRVFAANPDLPLRLQHKLARKDYKRDAFWGGNHVGYTDYPSYAADEAARADQALAI